MSNPLYQNNNPLNMLNQLKQNPIQFIANRGYKIPQNCTDPNSIIQHLLNSGQITQADYDKAMQMAQKFRY